MLESLWNGVRMLQPERGFRLGTDSVLLAEFLSLPANASVADLGAGCGTLGLLLCARDPGCTVTGLELRESACALAQENITLNALSSRLSVRQGDVRGIASYFPACSFDCVISNPPYFPVGSGKVSEDAAVARTELCLNLDELCTAAAWLLPSGGRFALVHRPERLCDLIVSLRSHGMEPKRIRFVRHTAAAPVCLVLIEARRGGRPGLAYEPDFIEFHADGSETDAYRAAYHRKGATP